MEPSVQTTEEKEVRRALDEYKTALNIVSFRNWWHRINFLFLGELPAIQAEKRLKSIEERVRQSVNQSEEHRRFVRLPRQFGSETTSLDSSFNGYPYFVVDILLCNAAKSFTLLTLGRGCLSPAMNRHTSSGETRLLIDWLSPRSRRSDILIYGSTKWMLGEQLSMGLIDPK